MILGGTIGLITAPRYRPLWTLSATSFTIGWVLNIVGHAFYEKNKPAFADDPLSFIAGPVWDLEQSRKKGGLYVVNVASQARARENRSTARVR